MLFISEVLYTISAILFYTSDPDNIKWNEKILSSSKILGGKFTSKQKLALVLMPTLIMVLNPSNLIITNNI